ncbi:molybdate ABC transporter substrate-binding protein [Pseudodesulfovibrio sediminis]|uniref:Molybdenum ABC transporter, periplasmic molybdate-binding protein n=1 Tax=Pseudodesulfovibrio sediminis TaxID=2810563 RepID=A0ABM7P9Q7_9BACT|nr:molybdate ABC transporter substrate-binding protein [Pseudodesulfovibrio sediminis]BCS89810.1 hypothetical protein PSDVSF_30520 [Pseudodesulfovibrio sediminis]
MHAIKTILLSALFIIMMTTVAAAENAVLASGAGYKEMVNELNAAYTKKSGQKLDLIYGNMARVTTQAKQSGQVDIVLGDQKFLTKARMPMASTVDLGRGRLVLAFAKSSKFSKVKDLDNPAAGRIALPDTNKAIYGKAAREFLLSSGRLPAIQARLVEVSTVPQVFSYLTTNEVDMGFLNLTHALKVKNKLGGFVIIDEEGYSPITIIASMLKTATHTDEAKAFLAFLNTEEARAIIKKHGL